MTRTPEQERVRTENVTLRVLRDKHPIVAELFEDQRRPFAYGATPDVEKLKRLKTAQCKWLDERRKAVNSATVALLVNKNDEFPQQKRDYLALGDKAVTKEPLRDGDGLITLAANGVMTGAEAQRELQREWQNEKEAAAKAAADQDKALDEMIAKGLAEGWLKPKAPPRKKKTGL